MVQGLAAILTCSSRSCAGGPPLDRPVPAGAPYESAALALVHRQHQNAEVMSR